MKRILRVTLVGVVVAVAVGDGVIPPDHDRCQALRQATRQVIPSVLG